MTYEPDSIDRFAGDRAGGAALRRSLQAIADQYAGEPLAHKIESVLAGRTTMRSLADDPEIQDMANNAFERSAQDWAALSGAEQRELVADAEKMAESLVEDETT